MAEFDAPVPLEEDPQEEGAAAPLLALLRRQQAAQQAEQERMRAGLQGTLGQQQAQAHGLRSLGLLSSFGANPLLRNLQGEAGQQAGILQGMTERTEGRLGTLAGRPSAPLDILRLKQAQQRLDIMGQREAGIDRRFDASQQQRAQQFAATMGFRWADLNQDQRLSMLRLLDAQEARAEARTARQDDKQTKLAERNVGGFEFDPVNPPSTEAAKKMADAAIARDEINASLGNLERMYKESGSELIGERAGQMESEWMNVTNRLRTLNEMGVPNGADYLMLAKQIEDPTELRNVITSKGRGLAKMATLREQVGRRIEATGKALKYKPVTAKSPTAPARTPAASVLPKDVAGNLTLEGPATTPPGDMIRIKINGMDRRVPRANLDAVKKRAAERRDALEVLDG